MKKVCCFFKSILLMILVLSFIFPSFAVLSQSDGSSFVTKAEFDSALADFNSRLTTFEAGINSKIDSQITTYLDRNGIWSGKPQTTTQPWYFYDMMSGIFGLNGKGFYNDTPFTSSISVSWYYGSNSSSLSSTTATVYISNPVLDKTSQQTIINSINKSGLLYLDFNVTFASQFGSYTPSSDSNAGKHPFHRWVNNVNVASGSSSVYSTTGWLTQAWYDDNINVPRLHSLIYYVDNYINNYDQLWVAPGYKDVSNRGAKYQYGIEIQINDDMINRQVVDQNYIYNPVVNGTSGNSNYTLPWSMMGETGVLRYTCSFFVRNGDKLSMGPYVVALGTHGGGVCIANRGNSKGYWIMGMDINDTKVY